MTGHDGPAAREEKRAPGRGAAGRMCPGRLQQRQCIGVVGAEDEAFGEGVDEQWFGPARLDSTGSSQRQLNLPTAEQRLHRLSPCRH
ncbi:Uncharacterised protein [Mycobacteroides abscessus subsp. abscessus]|nr:Uncharacterised protein [Mycobacteroides abscessus subsp. abscessus]